MWLNFLYMIMRTYFNSEKYLLQHSILYMHMNHLEWRNISAEKTFFHHFKKLVFHNFDACVVVLFLTHISNQKDIEKAEAVKKYIQQFIFFWFLQHVENICITDFKQKIEYKTNVFYSFSFSENHDKKNHWFKKQLNTTVFVSNQSAWIINIKFLNHVCFL